MTSKVINLRHVRKTKARDAKRATADANAVRHGQTKTERDVASEEKTRARRLLDGHEMNDGGSDVE